MICTHTDFSCPLLSPNIAKMYAHFYYKRTFDIFINLSGVEHVKLAHKSSWILHLILLCSDQFGARTNSIRSAVPEIFLVKGSRIFDRNLRSHMCKRTTFCTRIWQKNWTTPVRFAQRYLGFYLTVLNQPRTIQLRIQRWIFIDPYQNFKNIDLESLLDTARFIELL